MVKLSRAGTVAVFVFLALGAAACGGEPGGSELAPGNVASASSAMSAAPTNRAARYEVDFMTDMIDHHQMAIMMAEMCLEKAVHEELRAMCEDVISAQSAEIDTMQGWLQDWYGISYEPQMHRGADRMMDRLAALSPEEFEIEFMEMMIRHHAKAVKEGQKCVEKAYHPELVELCESIIEAQTAEIAQMEEWLCAWYGRC